MRLRLEGALRESSPPQGESRPTFARGETLTGRSGREITLEGGAEVRRTGTIVRGDRLTLYEADDELIGVGQVRVARDGLLITGPEVTLKLEANVGSFLKPSYFIPQTGGSGKAARAEFLGPGEMTLYDATYTTCRPEDPDWYLRADSFELDREADTATARGATIFFKDVPILAAPWLQFPMGDERRSGFLPPTLLTSTTYGLGASVPYYWAIAPNRDLTLFNNLTTRRGLQVEGLARYLEPSASGVTRFGYNPQDLDTGTSRWMFDSTHGFSDLWGWSGGWLLKGVSDDSYFIDYSRTIVQSAERSLQRNVFASRAVGDAVVTVRALSFQNILEARNAPPYNRLPQLSLVHSARDLGGFDVINNIDATYFTRDPVYSNGVAQPFAEGSRLIYNPSVAYPMGGSAWFITPKASLHATAYRLDANPSGPLDANRVLPTFSIDSGLVFERDAALFGQSMVQTLEPRLLYVYTPYRDQSQLPVFDSSVANLSFATLFSEQLFVGGDRIADANQITAGAVSRFIDPSNGAEALRLGAAQRIYFNDQRVTIPGVPSRKYSRSDVLLVASGRLSADQTLDAGVQWSIADGSVPRVGISWRYWPATDRLLNIAVRYQDNDYGQIDTSWRWPISGRWNTLGRMNYSFLKYGYDATRQSLGDLNPQLIEGLIGLEYRADCWVTRFVAQRYVTATSQQTTAFFIQLELNGLARIGLDPFDILTRNIPGYRPPSQRIDAPSKFLGYE